MAALRQHRTRQLEERLAADVAWHETGAVFVRQDGRELQPTNDVTAVFVEHVGARPAAQDPTPRPPPLSAFQRGFGGWEAGARTLNTGSKGRGVANYTTSHRPPRGAGVEGAG